MTRRSETSAIVLAAGDGKRLKSALPKVLHRAAGLPLLAHVLGALEPLELVRTVVVASARRPEIEAELARHGVSDGIDFAVQDPPNGTADATAIGLAMSGTEGDVLVTPGDTPLLTSETLGTLLGEHARSGAVATMLTARIADPAGYGRVVRSANGGVAKIVEDRDATEEELALDEVNAGVYVFDAARLSWALGKVDSVNAQGELYLTDVISILGDEDDAIAAVVADEAEVAGVNSRAQLAAAGGVLRRRTAERWMAEGVGIVDPATTYIDAGVEIGRDATILPFTFLEGRTTVAEGAEVGPQARIVDSTIGRGASVSFAVVRESTIGPEASVGPFASLRPGTTLGARARIGTFVESKQTTIGEDSKANHLAYLGDAEIGRGVNVGAGTITCNWDGTAKHKTVIEDEAYIGSDTMLVAPVHVGKRGATGAGSVVRGDVPDDALAVGVPARVIEGQGNKMKPRTEKSEDERSTDQSE
ncbi:MAG TPA: bifunctional UDP-N-acetylglucosamine diphosphorylase/glucosamine-1-phosphate N-acetyltransferase GlmU [Actinomycetota bacterium]